MYRVISILSCLVSAVSACAQSRAFFVNGVAGFDPEISVTESGNLLQPRVVTATPDLKHVRMGVGGGSVRVNDIHTFNIDIPDRPLGFVGGVNLTADASRTIRTENASVLTRRGMFLLAGP